MPDETPPEPLTVDARQGIFKALVTAQGGGLTVAASWDEIARRYGVTVAQVRAIEKEGLELDWPPLTLPD